MAEIGKQIVLYVLGRIDRLGGRVDDATARALRRAGQPVTDDLRRRREERRERAEKWGW